MKSLATAIAAIALIGTPAFAADMAIKAPPPAAPAPVYNWTGWYAGVNAGASFGSAKTDFNVSPVGNCSIFPLCAFTLAHGFSDKTYPTGFIGGGQVGYNWQYSPLIVVGLEADIQGALERDGATLTNSSTELGSAVSIVTNYTTHIDWFGTARVRIGYVWGNGEVLSYVTGGLAYGEVKINGTNTTSFSFVPIPFGFGSLSQSFEHSQVNTGWVVGYGTEGKLLIPGWTYKIEGLYMDLGTLDATGVTTGSSGNTGSSFGGQVTTHTHFTDGILRAGLNYKFY
jgi:outer membrane immunogenic protein